ncbi:MAG: cell division protein FtsZ [Fusobacteriaceae bacterium]|jgi:cell division protein FtsZ|nr:cell division protein FtsZ [Fusobacteriaceae bacterium]
MLQESKPVKIMVIGVGGGGGNAINDMTESGVTGVEFVAANTDVQDLNKSLANTRLQLGEKLTKGKGAGADPDIGRQAAEEDKEKIAKLLEGVDMVFITAGMGGGTGTGASPIIAEISREMGILTVAVVTKPFNFEGKKRANNAEMGIGNLEKVVDSIVIIPNDKLFELPEKKITLKNAFHEANKVLKIGIQGISDLMLKQGLINLDFADVKSILKNSGITMFGFGESDSKENRAVEAATKALESPLLEKQILGAEKILINITADESLGLDEAQLITNIIKDATGRDVEDGQWGVIYDDGMGGRLQVILVATNFTEEAAINAQKEKEKKTAGDGKGGSGPVSGKGGAANDLDKRPWPDNWGWGKN